MTERLSAIARCADDIALALQDLGLRFSHIDFIFDEEDSGEHGSIL
jgi:hypothetical protein